MAYIVNGRHPNNMNSLLPNIQIQNALPQFYFILTIAWSPLDVENDKTNDAKMYTYFAGIFDHHWDAAVQWGLQQPMEHIPGCTRSHWMLTSCQCLHRIAAPAATKVINVGCNNKNTNKTQL